MAGKNDVTVTRIEIPGEQVGFRSGLCIQTQGKEKAGQPVLLFDRSEWQLPVWDTFETVLLDLAEETGVRFEFTKETVSGELEGTFDLELKHDQITITDWKDDETLKIFTRKLYDWMEKKGLRLK